MFSNLPVAMVAIFIAYVLQVILTSFQISDYRKNLLALKDLGVLGTGKKRGLLGGEAVILVSDPNGLVLRAKLLKGISTFARYKDYPQIQGQYIDDIEKQCGSDKKKKHMLQAIDQVRTHLKRKEA